MTTFRHTQRVESVPKSRLFLLLCLFVFTPLFVSAQQPLRFGYLSYEAALRAMPGWADSQQRLDSLRQQCEAELKRAEAEFNAKYEEFLDGQRDFAPAILQKRQAELQLLMQGNQRFRDESARLLSQAETDSRAALVARLNEVLRQLGKERGYAFILNTDADAVPYVDPALGDDLSAAVAAALQ